MAHSTDAPTRKALTFRVEGMDCGSCADKIRTALWRLPGVSTVKVTFATESVNVEVEDGGPTEEAIERQIAALGYTPRRVEAKTSARRLHQDREQDPHETHNHHAPPLGNVPEARIAGSAASTPAAGRAKRRDEATEAHGHSHGHRHEHEDTGDRRWWETAKGRLVLLTGVLLVVAWGSKFVIPAFSPWLFVAATLIGAFPVARRAIAAARAGMPFTIEMLMTIAATGAIVIGAAEEAALVVFLFAVGEVLEGVAAGRARASIRALGELVPKTAMLEEAGATREVPADSLQVGQTVMVRPGDRIPADGIILSGTSGIDESPVTGESVPKTKGPDDPVFAGSINHEAVIRLRVEKAAEDNTISRIIRLVEEAQEAKAPTERFIDRFSRWYMPLIVVAAVLVALVPPLLFGQDWATWIYRALALLLIGCPCALVISVPASIASSLSAGARRGILMKGGVVIEGVAKAQMVAFDKTGTLTEGRPKVTDVVAISMSEGEVLSLAASLETGSSHPLATAIVARAKAQAVPFRATERITAVPGQGLEGIVEGCELFLGAPRFARDRAAFDSRAADTAERLESEGKTVAALVGEGRLLGLIALRDEPRPDAREGVAELKALGISSVMLTGDNKRTAAAIAGSLEMDERAELMPDDKVTAIRALAEHQSVMMIGDGINDAPALAAAQVGVAMGSGTDVALETADAALLRNQVRDVARMVRLARATMANIRQNIVIALGLKAVFLVTSVLGLTGLWIAILADTGATVIVTANALRLLGFFQESGSSGGTRPGAPATLKPVTA
ncbi:heavy metal translocating P-type ATPase [Methylobacterium isbiliense]|uniref:P-type Zn(2+) transporter n=1 Tax=Methylobacterium isbiliense TaxID=315478 RepID=A0ABQ4SAF8_9HYPH|nr:heavy metal translocating P-type ATPase [Methylobacterium isbiliense]MDN3626957.1 heavy metal translocating P-type ATPase [Methylobacterium isbiliense]GJD98772.1 Zinc/cadmium/lead-transporting P-type ATPase [Methylobacterium isbiliense]